MELKTFDILLLFILAIAISLIIAFNVLQIVDKKMGDITVNVPKLVCPTPNIIIKAMDGTSSKVPIKYVGEMYSSSTGMNNAISKYNINKSSKIEGFDTLEGRIDKSRDNETDFISPILMSGDNREQLQLSNGYSDYSDNDYYGYVDRTDYSGANFSNDSSIDASMGYLNPYRDIDESTKIANKMMYPKNDNIVRYDTPGCYSGITNNTIKKKVDEKKNVPLCRSTIKTDSINHFKTGMINASGEMILNDVNWYVYNLSGDPLIKGSNFGAIDFEPQADVDQIGSIPVNDYAGNPVPIGGSYDDKY